MHDREAAVSESDRESLMAVPEMIEAAQSISQLQAG